MSDHKRPWKSRDRQHFRKVEKRKKKGKVERALPPELNDAREERTYPASEAATD